MLCGRVELSRGCMDLDLDPVLLAEFVPAQSSPSATIDDMPALADYTSLGLIHDWLSRILISRMLLAAYCLTALRSFPRCDHASSPKDLAYSHYCANLRSYTSNECKAPLKLRFCTVVACECVRKSSQSHY